MLQIYGVPRMFDNLQKCVPHAKTWKEVHVNTCRQTDFEVHTPRSADLNPFLGHLKTLACSAVFQKKEILHHRIFMPSNHSLLPTKHSKVCDSPWSEVSMRALIQVEEILSICYQLWLDKPQELNSNWNGKVYRKYITSVVSKVIHSAGLHCWL